MGDTRSRKKRFQISGLAALLVGAVLGTSVMVSASSGSGEAGCQNSQCSISLSSNNGLSDLTPVLVTGRHFTARADGAAFECNMDPGAPTVSIANEKSAGIENFGPLSVGCSSPYRGAVKVSKAGRFAEGLGVITNVIGPPTEGTDSSGGSAAAAAAAYPCPPTQAQVDAGVSCAIVFQDARGQWHESAYKDIAFSTPFTTTTTTMTTDPNCPQVPNTVTSATASVTVTPATCLVGGTVMTMAATGLNPSDIGSFEECNLATNQPTAWNTVAGQAIPVGCTDPVKNIFGSNSAGALSPPAMFSGGAHTGTIGPPFSAAAGTEGSPPAGTPPADLPTDSNAQAIVDAPDYPCPPTPAQIANGDTCAIVMWDEAPRGGSADRVTVPISFDSSRLG
jgi:hypothetical protein